MFEFALQIDWARLAALIDGEGCICIPRAGRKRRYPVVAVYNTDPRMILWIQSKFGGHVSKKMKSKARKPLLEWRARRSETEQVLVGCLPYFLIKREQAEVAIAYERVSAQFDISERDSRKSELAEKIHVLNSGGSSIAV